MVNFGTENKKTLFMLIFTINMLLLHLKQMNKQNTKI